MKKNMILALSTVLVLTSATVSTALADSSSSLPANKPVVFLNDRVGTLKVDSITYLENATGKQSTKTFAYGSRHDLSFSANYSNQNPLEVQSIVVENTVANKTYALTNCLKAPNNELRPEQHISVDLIDSDKPGKHQHPWCTINAG